MTNSSSHEDNGGVDALTGGVLGCKLIFSAISTAEAPAPAKKQCSSGGTATLPL